MKTVEKMIEELQKFPKDAMCYGYEGEKSGLGITMIGLSGFIDTSDEDAPTEILVTKQQKVTNERCKNLPRLL